MNSSKPTAAINPARAAVTKPTGSRGSRPIIQVNSTHDTSTDTSTEMPRKISSNTENWGISSHLSTAAIGLAWPSTVSAMVATITTNVPTMAARSDSLVRK
ncbi:Uncharacterised protein [Mycobacterium tuberculosis]|uniref:Uncharacterized protein n=1 Tax=Mycobacterium tuberculosis TaxID=1773 RepID=A0A654U9E2_MYCTX|nr:Uncharacterised protein [Mycobacterium tuberculosis]CKS42743.1 Uncharacterised protein [Mycobacterium tuberculosis]CKT74250.1 Uncharacterised protein [Mycobacterium tuberculosis]